MTTEKESGSLAGTRSMTSRLDAASRPQSTSRARRIAALRGCAAAYHHLKTRGLVSDVVVSELQRCLRDAAA